MSKKEKDLKIDEEIEDLNEETPQNEEVSNHETEEISEIEKVTNELEAANNKYLRLYSDFENFRKRTSREKLELISSANEGLIKDLLSVLDDFQRAKAAMETSDDLEALKEGVNLIYNNFYKILENKGLKPIEAKDQVFDVEYHESVAQFAAGDDKVGLVIDEVEKGYFLHDKVLRYSKVVVGN